MRTDPSVGCVSPLSTRSIVDFPAPEGPRRMTNSPSEMENDTSSSATVSSPYRLVTFSNSIVGMRCDVVEKRRDRVKSDPKLRTYGRTLLVEDIRPDAELVGDVDDGLVVLLARLADLAEPEVVVGVGLAVRAVVDAVGALQERLLDRGLHVLAQLRRHHDRCARQSLVLVEGRRDLLPVFRSRTGAGVADEPAHRGRVDLSLFEQRVRADVAAGEAGVELGLRAVALGEPADVEVALTRHAVQRVQRSAGRQAVGEGDGLAGQVGQLRDVAVVRRRDDALVRPAAVAEPLEDDLRVAGLHAERGRERSRLGEVGRPLPERLDDRAVVAADVPLDREPVGDLVVLFEIAPDVVEQRRVLYLEILLRDRRRDPEVDLTVAAERHLRVVAAVAAVGAVRTVGAVRAVGAVHPVAAVGPVAAAATACESNDA